MCHNQVSLYVASVEELDVVPLILNLLDHLMHPGVGEVVFVVILMIPPYGIMHRTLFIVSK